MKSIHFSENHYNVYSECLESHFENDAREDFAAGAYSVVQCTGAPLITARLPRLKACGSLIFLALNENSSFSLSAICNLSHRMLIFSLFSQMSRCAMLWFLRFFAISFYISSAALTASCSVIPVELLMSLSHDVGGRPLFLFPLTDPCDDRSFYSLLSNNMSKENFHFRI